MIIFIFISFISLCSGNQSKIELEFQKETEIDRYDNSIDVKILNDTNNVCHIFGNRLYFQQKNIHYLIQHQDNDVHPHHLDYLMQHVIIVNYDNYTILTSNNKLYQYTPEFKFKNTIQLRETVDIPQLVCYQDRIYIGYQDQIQIIENGQSQTFEQHGLIRVHHDFIYLGQLTKGLKIYSTDLEFKYQLYQDQQVLIKDVQINDEQLYVLDELFGVRIYDIRNQTGFAYQILDLYQIQVKGCQSMTVQEQNIVLLCNGNMVQHFKENKLFKQYLLEGLYFEIQSNKEFILVRGVDAHKIIWLNGINKQLEYLENGILVDLQEHEVVTVNLHTVSIFEWQNVGGMLRCTTENKRLIDKKINFKVEVDYQNNSNVIKDYQIEIKNNYHGEWDTIKILKMSIFILVGLIIIVILGFLYRRLRKRRLYFEQQ